VQTTVDDIQLEIVHSVYKNKVVYEKLEGGEVYPEKKEVLVKQIKVKKWFKKEAIVSVEEYVTTKNKVAKTRSIVFDKYSSRFYATYHNADEVMKNISNRTRNTQIGFNNDTHIYPAGSQIQKYRK
jgi:hypothetical protein